ncbi:hypothetical protein [Seleniivibrio woodruffii]|uniref:hypothetical protein n=1 Tax=Seleniivibrio woodruffii TaxID=1078050 RepID=UPI0024097011|nr:hypothetical protein [Seleniivibrio woodruffii]
MEEKRENQCVVEGCGLDRYEGHDKCILHCKKELNSFKSHKEFFKSLTQHIAKHYSNSENIHSDCILAFFGLPSRLENNTLVIKKLYDKIDFYFICFPPIDQTHHYFFDILNKFGIIHFYHCEFYNLHHTHFPLKQYVFDQCKFQGTTIETSHSQQGNTYSFCSFQNYTYHETKNKEFPPTFFACEFISASLLNLKVAYPNISEWTCEKITIIESTFTKILYLHAKEIELKSSIFSSDVIIPFLKDRSHNSVTILIYDVDIHGTLDISNLTIESLTLSKVLSNTVTAYNTTLITKPIISDFKVSNLVNFNGAIFKVGLDLDYAYFFGSTFFNHTNLASLKQNCSAATYRIIKDSFDKAANTLEANTFFALEMDKLYRELTWAEQPKDKFLLFVNKVTSNYGQNWLLPVFWIFIFSSAFLYIKSAHSNGYLSGLDTNSFLTFLNALTGIITPLSSFLKKGMEFISLVFGIIFTILIYQTIVALKRKTRR